MISESSSILLKNIGFDPEFFTSLDKRNIYVIKQDKIKKVYSDGAIVRIPTESIILRPHEAEDRDLYGDAEGIYDPFDGDSLVDNYIQHDEIGTETEEDKNLAIFQNCSRDQISNLNAIISRMNEAPEEKVIIKAYKSKLKSKFYDIYEQNSKILKEKTKYKIFHKCNFPGCGRTFASSGWLKSHFHEHMKEIRKNKFNILFDEFIEQMTKAKLMLG
jgi:hypothetical protein